MVEFTHTSPALLAVPCPVWLHQLTDLAVVWLRELHLFLLRTEILQFLPNSALLLLLTSSLLCLLDNGLLLGLFRGVVLETTNIDESGLLCCLIRGLSYDFKPAWRLHILSLDILLSDRGQLMEGRSHLRLHISVEGVFIKEPWIMPCPHIQNHGHHELRGVEDEPRVAMSEQSIAHLIGENEDAEEVAKMHAEVEPLGAERRQSGLLIHSTLLGCEL